MKVTILPLYDHEAMWRTVREMARQTVGKDDIETLVSDQFKRNSVISEHSPLRMLLYKVYMENIPTYIAQQYSRHRIATNSGDFMHENVNPTDVEHFVQTQRSDRTGKARGSQEDPIDYKFVANAQGIIDMSKKRMCSGASPIARKLWIDLVTGLSEHNPILASVLGPSCTYCRYCPEVGQEKCKFMNSQQYNDIRRSRLTMAKQV